MIYPNRRDVLMTLGALAAGVAIGEPAPYLRGMTASTTSEPNSGGNGTPMITTKDGAQIFYKDWGPKDAQPIVFHHGWPLSSDDWDNQMLFFLANGYRVVAHDRRGHGRSSQVGTGHDMAHYASDASAVAEHLDLRNAVHIGHSTGGGEVARYVAKYGAPQGRVAQAGLTRTLAAFRSKCSTDSARRLPRTGRSSFSMSLRVRFTASTDPARRVRRESSRTGGVRG